MLFLSVWNRTNPYVYVGSESNLNAPIGSIPIKRLKSTDLSYTLKNTVVPFVIVNIKFVKIRELFFERRLLSYCICGTIVKNIQNRRRKKRGTERKKSYRRWKNKPNKNLQ